MSKYCNLSKEDIQKIEKSYKPKITDVFLQKKLSNMEKTKPWISVKNNTKTNKFKKKKEMKHRNDPYKFKNIPSNMREIILNLCKKNEIGLQTLAFKSNISLHIIDRYINNNYILDNYDLHILMKTLNFDLIKYINDNNNNK